MAIRNLSHLISLVALRCEIIATHNEVKAHPLTQGYAPVYEGLRNDWSVVFDEELGLRDGLGAAIARIGWIKVLINAVASRVSKALLNLTQDDRTHPLYVAYFKKKSLCEFKRLALLAQTDAMRGWIPELTGNDVPALAVLGAEVNAAVTAADNAMTTRDALETQIGFFRDTGNRKKLFSKVNAVRKQTHGDLSKMPHEKLGLPTNFADLFFLHESNAAEKPPTLDSIDKELAILEQQLTEKKEQRKALEAELESEVKEEAERVMNQVAIAELKKVEADAEKKAAEAKAKIAELSQ